MKSLKLFLLAIGLLMRGVLSAELVTTSVDGFAYANLGTNVIARGVGVSSDGQPFLAGWELDGFYYPVLLDPIAGTMTRLGRGGQLVFAQISDNAAYIAATFDKEIQPWGFEQESVLYRRDDLENPIPVPEVATGRVNYTRLLGGVSNDGVAAGESSDGEDPITAFTFSEAAGSQALPLPPGTQGSVAYGVSSSGRIAGDCFIGGFHVPTIWDVQGGVTVLSVGTGTSGGAFAVSANGRLVGGDVNLAAAIWVDGEPSFPRFPESSSNGVGPVLWMTDEGYYGGRSDNGAWFAGPGMEPILFTDWWLQNTGEQFPIPVTVVFDALYKDGVLHMAVNKAAQINSPSIACYARAPIQASLPRPRLTARMGPGELSVTWPIGSENFILEASETFGQNMVWTPVPPPYVTNGNQMTISVSPTEGGPSKFFRLRQIE